MNVAGSLSSTTLGVVLADVPATPASEPTYDPSQTNHEQILLQIASFDGSDPLQTGGSTVLSYSLEVDDGAGGSFIPLYGESSDSLSTSYLLRRPGMRGLIVRARYRARNAVGWSSYSPISYTRAASRPRAPTAPPRVAGATSTSISLVLTRSEDNGGSPIVRHELWIDDGALGAYRQVTSYDGSSLEFTILLSLEQYLLPGLVYRVRFLAVNDVGASDFSGSTAVALASLPAAADVPVRLAALSTESKVVLQWTPPSSTDSPGGEITGYVLEMDDGLLGDFEVIYDGDNAPSLTQFAVGGSSSRIQIVPGRGYRFRLAARAFNGLGPVSAVTTIYACSPPRNLAAPLLETATSTSMTLTWSAPLYDGACPITGYTLFMDDGSSGDPSIRVAGLASGVPTLRQVTVPLPASDLGTTYTFKLQASNRQGSVPSARVSYLFAVAPSKPPSGPAILSTSSRQITVRYDQALNSEGGSPPISYHLQLMAAYTGGIWVDLSGGDLDSLLTLRSLTSGLRQGETYSFRYRVKNAVGWSDFSEPTSVVAADPPSKPLSAPVIVGDPTSTSVTLQFDRETIGDGGSPITAYILEICEDTVHQDQCLQDSEFTTVSSYTGAYRYTMTTTAAQDDLSTGSFYRLRYRAVNVVGGQGPPSDPVAVAIVDKPGGSSLIQKSMAYSSKTSLSLSWSPVTVDPTQLPGGEILGYKLYATDPLTGRTWAAFDGVSLGLRDQTRATVLGLVTGRMYQFEVVAYNFNGAGAHSVATEFYSCVLPSGFTAPRRTDSTTSSIEIGWAPPRDSGGCAITGYVVFKDDGTGTGAFSEVNSPNDLALRN